MEIIRNLPLECSNCGRAVNSHNMEQHISSGCKLGMISSPPSVLDAASESIGTPVQDLELQAAANILRRYRHANAGSPNENILKVPSSSGGGKVNLRIVL